MNQEDIVELVRLYYPSEYREFIEMLSDHTKRSGLIDTIRRMADNNESFENGVFEIGLNAIIESVYW